MNFNHASFTESYKIKMVEKHMECIEKDGKGMSNLMGKFNFEYTACRNVTKYAGIRSEEPQLNISVTEYVN